jgi:hypothetical protein
MTNWYVLAKFTDVQKLLTEAILAIIIIATGSAQS